MKELAKRNFIIAIPTYKRANYMLERKGTAKYISDFLWGRVVICARKEEVYEYTKVHDKYFTNHEYFDVKNIVETRDVILKYAFNTTIALDSDCAAHNLEVPLEYLFMIDDDIKFAYRPNMDNKYVEQTPEIFEKMIESMLNVCNEYYPIVGITPRQFSQKKTCLIDVNSRIIQVYCFHLPTLKKTGVKFGDLGIPFMTDYYFVIKHLTLGYKNAVLNRYTKDDTMQAHGGCEENRTVEKLNLSASRLCQAFPNIVTLYWKKHPKFNTKFLNPRILWKKAYTAYRIKDLFGKKGV